MINNDVSIFQEDGLSGSGPDESALIKRAQGRPARGQTEVGSKKIVEGMRAALRTLGNTNVSRKDVAQYAGVTPALVTYYFPERDTLIAAATLPVVEALVREVKSCLIETGSERQQLGETIKVLLEYYARDAVIIELFETHKTATPSTDIPDLLKDLETALIAFFERWIGSTASVFSAEFLQQAMIGTCKSVARIPRVRLGCGAFHDPERLNTAGMICSMLLRSISAA